MVTELKDLVWEIYSNPTQIGGMHASNEEIPQSRMGLQDLQVETIRVVGRRLLR